MKSKIAIIMLGVAILLTGCSGIDFLNKDSNDKTLIYTSDYKGVEMVSVSEAIEKIENRDQYIFVLGNENCSACLVYKEDLKKLESEEGIRLDYIDTSVEERADVQDLLSNVLGIDISEGVATPTTYFIKDGEVVDYIVGAVSPKDLMTEKKEFFEYEKSRELVETTDSYDNKK